MALRRPRRRIPDIAINVLKPYKACGYRTVWSNWFKADIGSLDGDHFARIPACAGTEMNGQIGLFVAALLMPVVLVPGMQQPPPPGPPNPPDRLDEILRQTATTKAVDKTAQRAIAYSRAFAESGEKRLQSGESFAAGRMAEAADAMLQVAEHQQHLRTGGGPKGPPRPLPIQDQLQRTYFKIQQADYFLSQAHDARAASFPKWSNDFYQLAVRAYERHDLRAADENAKSAEDIVRALENLAQADASPHGGVIPPGAVSKGPL